MDDDAAPDISMGSDKTAGRPDKMCKDPCTVPTQKFESPGPRHTAETVVPGGVARNLGKVATGSMVVLLLLLAAADVVPVSVGNVGKYVGRGKFRYKSADGLILSARGRRN